MSAFEKYRNPGKKIVHVDFKARKVLLKPANDNDGILTLNNPVRLFVNYKTTLTVTPDGSLIANEDSQRRCSCTD